MDTGHGAQQVGPMSPSEDKAAGLGEQGPIQRARGCPPVQRHTLVSLGVGGRWKSTQAAWRSGQTPTQPPPSVTPSTPRRGAFWCDPEMALE